MESSEICVVHLETRMTVDDEYLGEEYDIPTGSWNQHLYPGVAILLFVSRLSFNALNSCESPRV